MKKHLSLILVASFILFFPSILNAHGETGSLFFCHAECSCEEGCNGGGCGGGGCDPNGGCGGGGCDPNGGCGGGGCDPNGGCGENCGDRHHFTFVKFVKNSPEDRHGQYTISVLGPKSLHFTQIGDVQMTSKSVSAKFKGGSLVAELNNPQMGSPECGGCECAYSGTLTLKNKKIKMSCEYVPIEKTAFVLPVLE